ncbi:flagellar M-ring protein FliF [Palleronia pelagia]|uniref:Flagellar M-ring protein n=1 Tax=Palleronia pelagia TaxID=387096 RepID=A0A1H8L436_9RHOB|nr:flagellar M-ring protein FliF [Palleronia pelagia]
MQQLANTWSDLSVQKRVVAALALVAVVIMVIGLGRMATRPGLALLYAELDNSAAGEVVSALEQRGVTYSVRGGAIYVDSTQRDQLRMTLAAEGLPANSGQGYELLDRMTGFGTTSQMFDAAYWRAKEGELARTIVASPAITAARVHIANSGTKPFQRDVTPTASVTVTPAQGGLGAAHARALRFLVASAVSGLAPENVSVIDSNGGVILAGPEGDTPAGDAADRAAALKRNVERLLEARVGYGNAVVEVNIETVTDREQITERRIEPDSRVAISQDRTESTSSESGTGGASVTVASNLPDGDADGGSEQQSQASSSETRERTNFEVSEIQREILRAPGAIDRITTAVLVDGITAPGPDGDPAWAPRPEDEMEALRALVAAAVGFNAERGDELTIQTMQFQPLPDDGTGPGGLMGAGLAIDAMRLIQLGILAVVALVLGLFVVRPILTQKAASPEPEAPALGFEPPPFMSAPLFGEIDPDDTPASLKETQSLADFGGGSDDADDATPGAVERLRNLIDERQDESLQILRSWMEEDEVKS